eukprot:GHVU01223422.1.p1 GENE.GHVU01223422.1~~GHVU01223422.1.p1  ORF type:complete len:115 (+),score=0.85 GHVU01223422.1:188-532(+)
MSQSVSQSVTIVDERRMESRRRTGCTHEADASVGRRTHLNKFDYLRSRDHTHASLRYTHTNVRALTLHPSIALPEAVTGPDCAQTDSRTTHDRISRSASGAPLVARTPHPVYPH